MALRREYRFHVLAAFHFLEALAPVAQGSYTANDQIQVDLSGVDHRSQTGQLWEKLPAIVTFF